MALLIETLDANADLASLTAEQKAAIVTLSTNDEEVVIGAKVKGIHDQYDTDVKAITGVERNQNEKTYDYVKRTLGDYKTKVEASAGDAAKIAAFQADIAKLTDQIAKGDGDAVIRQKLVDAEGKLTALQGAYDTDKNAWAKEKDGFTAQITDIQVGGQFNKAIAGLKFKAEYPASVQKYLIKANKEDILAKYKPDWVEAGGEKVMVFRDANGEILRNKANKLEPFTAAELMAENLKEALEVGRKAAGAGTGAPEGTPATIELVDIAGAKNQIEADEIISKYLLQKGMLRTDQKFGAEQARIRRENKVEALPFK